MRGGNVGFLALVVDFMLPPLIRHGFAVPPSPEGEGFGAVENPRGRRGHAPALRTVNIPIRFLSGIEPGDPQRWWSTTRVSGSHCQRPLAAPLSRLRRQLSQKESQGVVFVRGCALVWCICFVRFRRSSSDPACAGPPSPPGEGFGAEELGGCSSKLTWAAGACPRPTHG